jgi:hypothetical protein
LDLNNDAMIAALSRQRGYELPTIRTPFELLEASHDE